VKLVHLILNNFLFKVLALGVAFALWAATQGIRSEEASIDLAIELTDQRTDEVAVLEQSAEQINVKIVGSRAAVQRAREEKPTYPNSLRDVKPGELRETVDRGRVRLPRGASIAAWAPSVVVLKLEPVIKKTVQVEPDVIGTPPPSVRLLQVRVDPPEVELSGPESRLRRLSVIATERVDLSRVLSTRSIRAKLLLPSTASVTQGSDPVNVVVEIETPGDEVTGSAPGT
jgi:YbbR domain-containing protein